MTSLDPDIKSVLYEEKIELGGMLDLKISGSNYQDEQTTIDMINDVRMQFITNCDAAVVLRNAWNVDSVDYFGSKIVSDFNLRIKHGGSQFSLWMKNKETFKYALERKKLDDADTFICAVNFGEFEIAKEIYKTCDKSKIVIRIWNTEVDNNRKFRFLIGLMDDYPAKIQTLNDLMMFNSIDIIDAYLDKFIITDNEPIDFAGIYENDDDIKRNPKFDEPDDDLDRYDHRIVDDLEYFEPQEPQDLNVKDITKLKKCLSVVYADLKHNTLDYCVKEKNMDLIEYLIDLELDIIKWGNNLMELSLIAQFDSMFDMVYYEFTFPTIGHKLLAKAIKYDNLDLVKYLFQFERYKINSGKLLYKATRKDNSQIAEYMINSGLTIESDLKIYDFDLNCAFYEAIRNNHVNVVKMMMKFSFKMFNFMDFILELSEYGHLEMIQFLTIDRALEREEIERCIETACEHKHKHLVVYFTDLLIDNDMEINWALYLAAQNGYFDICVKLIENGAHVVDYDISTIQNAYEYGDRELTKYLVLRAVEEHKTLDDYNAETNILADFIKNGDLEMLKFFAETGAFDMTQEHLMQEAIDNDKLEIREYLNGLIKK